MSDKLVSQMLKAVTKDIDAKSAAREGKTSFPSKKKRKTKAKHREGVRQSYFLAEAANELETEGAKRRRAANCVKMMTSKAMKGDQAKVAQIIRKQLYSKR